MTPNNAIPGKKGFQTVERPLDRFWGKVNKDSSPNGCWLWTGSTDGRYGVFWSERHRKERAPRYVWRITYGPVPSDMHVCHKCDTPLCVRPDHLFLGSMKDNIRDCANKRRLGCQVFGPTEIQMAIVLRQNGYSAEQIAKSFRVDISTVFRNLREAALSTPAPAMIEREKVIGLAKAADEVYRQFLIVDGKNVIGVNPEWAKSVLGPVVQNARTLGLLEEGR